jgi:hypothetical protein
LAFLIRQVEAQERLNISTNIVLKVGALGYPDTGKIDVTDLNRAYGFHDTKLHPSIEYAFHALALDEHRRPFSPTLWSLPEQSKDTLKDKGQPATKKLIQCWFPGMHINIGGGSSDVLDENKKHLTDMESMSNITYAWMVDRIRENTELAFDEQTSKDIIGRYIMAMLQLGAAGKTQKGTEVFGGWGLGPVADSFDNMRLGGSMTRTPGQYPEKGVTHEYIHPIVAFAKSSKAPNKYNTPALDGFVRVKRTDPKNPGYDWVKTFTKRKDDGKGALIPAFSYIFGKSTKPEGEKTVVSIPEFIIPEDSKLPINNERYLVTSSWLATLQAPPATAKAGQDTHDFFAQLDKDNGLKSWTTGGAGIY